MLIKYANSCKLMYTDTNSLIYQVKCMNIYSDMKQDIHKFDTSDYFPNNVFGIAQDNKKIVGLMKDECSGQIVTEFVVLQSSVHRMRKIFPPTMDPTSSLRLPHSTNFWQWSEEETVSWWEPWWEQKSYAFWDHCCRVKCIAFELTAKILSIRQKVYEQV